ncbi:MAG: hypothetical protein R8F63_07320 [Acidimicrobiales bacterium]|nr:hypothetical protein [Acidimicrobiales bacterium]
MPTRLPSLLDDAILFAHRGARTTGVEQAREAFERALQLGATGLQADAWLTADGEVVLDRTGLVRRLPRRRAADVNRSDVAGWLTLDELLALPTDSPIRLRVADTDAARVILERARRADAAERLWLAHPELETLAEWRDLSPVIHLVNATSVKSLPFGPERRAAELAAGRVDAVALPEAEWTGGHVTLFHRFEVLAFADGAHYERQIARVIDMGIDAVSGDHVERLVAVAATFA